MNMISYCGLGPGEIEKAVSGNVDQGFELNVGREHGGDFRNINMGRFQQFFSDGASQFR